MSTQRDPFKNPQRGDFFDAWCGEELSVLIVGSKYITYVDYRYKEHTILLKSFARKRRDYSYIGVLSEAELRCKQYFDPDGRWSYAAAE